MAGLWPGGFVGFGRTLMNSPLSHDSTVHAWPTAASHAL